MMLAHNVRPILQRELRTHLAAGTMNTGQVIIAWDAAAVPADVNVEADYANPDLRTATVQAFIHYVSAKAVASNWTSYEAGDVIVTFDAPDLDLEGKRTVSFLLPDGRTYTQRETDRDPVEFWSTFVGGETLTKTLLLRRKPEVSRLGQVYYIGAGGRRILLYTYNPAARTFTAPDPGALTGRAEIDLSTAGELSISLGGVVVLTATADGVTSPEFIALGATTIADEPRLEFYHGPVRCAALSASRLASATMQEGAAPPDTARLLVFGNPDWLFSFTPAGATAPAYTEP